MITGIPEQSYRSLFEYHPDMVYSMDLDGNYISINRSFEELVGYTRDEIIQSPLNFRSLIDPSDVERAEFHFGQAANGRAERYEIMGTAKNGRRYFLDVTYIPIVIENKVMGVYGIARDITGQKQLWTKLEESRQLYRLLSEHAQDIITYAAPDGMTRFISPALTPLLGYEPEEVVGTPVYELWHPDDKAVLDQAGILRHSDTDHFTCRVLHKDGHYIWLESTVKAVRNADGEMEAIVGVGRDITERKQAEEELRKTKERLESFIQNNADAIWVIDLEDTVLEANAAFETVFQWAPYEIIGKKLPIIPDFLKDSNHAVHARSKTGQSVTGYETIRQRKDGTFVEISVTLSPLRDEKGAIIGISGVCRDISTRERAEEELKAAKASLESFIEHNIDPIMIFNIEDQLIRVNEAFEATYGWKASELLGQHITRLQAIPAAAKPEIINNLSASKTGQSVRGLETTALTKDGTVVSVMVSSFPIRDSKENINGSALILRDMTDRKHAEQVMINSEKLSIAGELAAGIAHEIRNPITAIKGFIQLMKSGIEKKQYFDIITSEIERIELILSELLVLAKPQTVKFEQKDIRVLLAQVTTLLDSLANLNNVQIVTEFDPGVTYIQCDENQLKQVFINFIKNGIEAMPKGGKIVIQIKYVSCNELLVRIIDQGCGIPDHLISKLGQPFYTTKDKGTGLGFMISKRIIENHEGQLQVHSEQNKGTTLELRLPLEHS